MRKILAGFLATSMIVAVASSVTFAATPAAGTYVVNTYVAPSAGETYDSITLDLDERVDTEAAFQLTESINIPIPSGTSAASANAMLAKELNGLKFKDVEYNGKYYTVTLKQNGTNSPNMIATFSPAVQMDASGPVIFTLTLHEATAGLTSLTSSIAWTDGAGTETQDADRSGAFTNVAVADVVKSYGDGTPIPLTEDPIGVDKDQNGEGGVQSGKTVYFMLLDDYVQKLDDDTYWKLKITKGDNGKYISKVSDTTKTFKNDLYDVNTGRQVLGTGDGTRHRYIKVELNDIYTDDEYKITLDMRISSKSKAVDSNVTVGGTRVTDDTELKVNDFSFYMKNIVKNADNDWKVGVGGLMLNPISNDWNDVTYYDEDGDVAHMKFFADSDTEKFFSKLSTKWPHEDYVAYFNDQDAFLFQFTGSPKLSSTSRADLEIYNPFVDEDGNETIDPATAVIYQIVDGDLYKVTDQFEYKEGDNGDMAFVTRTRFLGTYVICEKEIAEAVGEDETVPEELTPDTNAGAPSEVPVDNGGKAPANTGRYL